MISGVTSDTEGNPVLADKKKGFILTWVKILKIRTFAFTITT